MPDTSKSTLEQADYIIVGGGSAGAVLANRLSEDTSTSVLLLEAGGDGKSFLVQLPVGYIGMLQRPKFDWAYEQEPDPTLNGRSWTWCAGRMLGGGSSLNGQVYIRGTREDFNEWARLGATGWSFEDVLPYFLKSEMWQGPPSQWRGSYGPLTVAPMRDPHPLCKTFLDACSQLGMPLLEDHNDGSGFGAFLTQTNQRDGWRCSTEKAYLRPIQHRRNLRIVTAAEVDRIKIDDGRAIGVEYERAGRRESVIARREVLVCAGAIGSPALLMRSGIGPPDELRSHGIEVVHASPGVGRNLLEHSACPTYRSVSVPTINTETGPLDMARHFAKFFLTKTGALVSPGVQAMAFAKTRPELQEPDVQLHFQPMVFELPNEPSVAKRMGIPSAPAVTVIVSLCRPKGQGRVMLNERLRPKIRHGALGHPEDAGTLVDGLRLVDRLYNTRAFTSIVTDYLSPRSKLANTDEWMAFMRENLVITWHAVGTCRMGSDAEAVVDPQLRVNGVQGLRVVDASVMPIPPSGNTNAATIMIGERAAHLIQTA